MAAAPNPEPRRIAVLFEPRHAQTFDEMLDPVAAAVEAGEDVFHEGKTPRIQIAQRGDSRLRLGSPVELAQPGDNVAQPRRPIFVKRPSAATDLDSLLIIPQLIVSAGESGQPDEQTGVAGA